MKWIKIKWYNMKWIEINTIWWDGIKEMIGSKIDTVNRIKRDEIEI